MSLIYKHITHENYFTVQTKVGDESYTLHQFFDLMRFKKKICWSLGLWPFIASGIGEIKQLMRDFSFRWISCWVFALANAIEHKQMQGSSEVRNSSNRNNRWSRPVHNSVKLNCDALVGRKCCYIAMVVRDWRGNLVLEHFNIN